MGKRKKRSVKLKAKQETENERPATANPPVGQEERFDFGGLPERDLKKSLGCG